MLGIKKNGIQNSNNSKFRLIHVAKSDDKMRAWIQLVFSKFRGIVTLLGIFRLYPGFQFLLTKGLDCAFEPRQEKGSVLISNHLRCLWILFAEKRLL